MKILLATQPLPAAPFADAIRSRAPELSRRISLGAGRRRPCRRRGPRRVADATRAAGPLAAAALGVLDRRRRREAALARSRAACARLAHRRYRAGAGIAQFVVAMALRHARALERYELQQRERAWLREPTPMARHRVAVLGTGAMGSEIAAWLERCGLVVRGWNRRSPEGLHALLAASEIVVCALPLTPETENILDARAFAAMPRGAYVINVARGAHVDEAALIDAVRSGHLSGAALDVQRRAAACRRPALDLPGHHDHAAHRRPVVDRNDRRPVRRRRARPRKGRPTAQRNRPRPRLLSARRGWPSWRRGVP